MHKLKLYSGILIGCLLLLAADPASAGVSPVFKTRFSGKAIGGYDAVAYHTLKKAVKGEKKYLFKWKGADWYFASAENQARFTKEPETYAPRYGGYCSWAAASNKLVKSDPKVFDLHEGMLYLNYSRKTQKEWQADKALMIRRADSNYRNLIKK